MKYGLFKTLKYRLKYVEIPLKYYSKLNYHGERQSNHVLRQKLKYV